MGELTIDELARQAGTRTSTVRMYQTRGMLPPPQIRGRVGYYSAPHLTRLRVIARLQERGFSLAAIKDLLDGFTRGASLATILGAEQELSTLGEPTELTEADFTALFPDGEIDLAAVQRGIALGLLAFGEDGTVRTPSRAFVEIGRELARHKVPPTVQLDEYERLAADARQIADRFVALFERYVVGAAAPTPDRLAELAESVRRFRAMAADAVQELVARAVDDAAAAAVARYADPAAPPDADSASARRAGRDAGG